MAVNRGVPVGADRHNTAHRGGHHHRGCGLPRQHPLVGHYSAGIADHLGPVAGDDFDRLQPFFQALHGNDRRAHPNIRKLYHVGGEIQYMAHRCIHLTLDKPKIFEKYR